MTPLVPSPGRRPRTPTSIAARYTPQTRTTPTLAEATAVIAFVRARLAEHTARTAVDVHLITAITGRDGLLGRYRAAARHASAPPRGLEEAWGLVAATLAVSVGHLAALWPDHPDYSPHWHPPP